MTTKRILTEFEERVYRLCSPEFEDRTQQDAANVLGVSQQTVSRTIARIFDRCPTLAFTKTKPGTVRFEEYMSDKVTRRF